MSKVKRIKERNSKAAQQVANWNSVWQVVGECVTQTKQDFEQSLQAGEFLNEDIYDSTATFAMNNASSALLGMLWPTSAKKSIRIDASEEMEDVTDEERLWYEKATKKLTAAMDNPKSNLILALDEYMIDQITFGTSGVGVFFEESLLVYRSFSVKELRIDEGRDGRVDTTFLNYEWTVKRVIDTYGEDNVSQKLRDLMAGGKEAEKVKILVVYEMNDDEDDMLVQSTHLEIENDHIIKEGGFEEFPILVARWRKLGYEKYGRSPAMNALPDIRELNVLKEAVIVATEKLLDPALGVLNDAMVGNGVVDTSSGALTVFDASGNIGNSPPVFPINTVGDLNAAFARIQDLEDSIAQHFFIDRLLDFNNQTQMTATETNQRASIRNSSLSSLLARQITEVFTPLVERSFNILLRNDELGFFENTVEAEIQLQFEGEVELIPERIAERLLNAEDAYQVIYTTPADRVANAEELDGMIQMINLNQQLALTNPKAVKYLDIANIQENGVRLYGAPTDMIRGEEEVEEEDRAEQEQLAQQQQLEQAQQVAGIAGELQ